MIGGGEGGEIVFCPGGEGRNSRQDSFRANFLIGKRRKWKRFVSPVEKKRELLPRAPKKTKKTE